MHARYGRYIRKPVAFISYDSKDVDIARRLATELGIRGVDVWIDEDQIRFGDSVPGRIGEGLADADLILVLISRHLLASSWCRAEYEALLAREIDEDRAIVIPVRLDDAVVPALLSAKRYVDFRRGLSGAELIRLVTSITRERAHTRVKQLLPPSSSYEASALSMIIGSTLQLFPVAALPDEAMVQGSHLVDLYRTVERLVERYQALFDELSQILTRGLTRGTERLYPSSEAVAAVESANRRLRGIAADMREIARHVDGLLPQGSALRRRLRDVLELCVEISVIEDFLDVRLGVPFDLCTEPQALMDDWPGRGPRREVPVADKVQDPGSLGPGLLPEMLRDVNRVRLELDAYQRRLRSAVARVNSDGARQG